MAEKIVSVHLDANESVFFARELEYVKNRTYDKKYPDLRYSMFLPVSTEANPGAESITFTSYDQVGIAKIIANYADDLPRCDAFGTQTETKVKGIGDAYGYSIQEIRNSMMANKNLDARKASACRRAIEQKINECAWKARGVNGLYGCCTIPQ